MPPHVRLLLQCPAYWQNDDHDASRDDCWSGMEAHQLLPMTFAEGQRIFLQQAPMGPRTYGHFRRGRGAEISLTERRDYRSTNPAPDGPGKIIWGPEQKKRLMGTLLARNADFNLLISPTPIVRPDRPDRRDSHANQAFAWEGNQFRQWTRRHPGSYFFAPCGDRHWRQHSVHLKTGLHEFACGAASDEHAGGSPGYDPAYPRFHRVAGGFLPVTFQREGARGGSLFRRHAVHGRPLHEHATER